MSFGREGWPVHIVADVLASGREGTLGEDATVFGGTLEAATGIRKIWGNKQIHPYVGAGLTLLSAAVEVESPLGTTDDQDVALGPWAGGGIFWRLGTRFNIGIDLRWSAADVELDFDDGGALRDLDAGGMHYGLTLGFGW